MRLAPVGVIRTGGPDPRGFPRPSGCHRQGKPGAVSALKALYECCHISASPGLSVVIIERCIAHTGRRRSATLLASIVCCLLKDHYPPQQQGRTGLQGALYVMLPMRLFKC